MTGCQCNLVRWWHKSILCRSLPYKQSRLNIAEDFAIDDPLLNIHKHTKGPQTKIERVNFLSIWQSDTAAQRDKLSAAKLQCQAIVHHQVLATTVRERGKDRILELQKVQNEKHMILLHHYEMAASMGKSMEVLFPIAWSAAAAAFNNASLESESALPLTPSRRPLSGVLSEILCGNLHSRIGSAGGTSPSGAKPTITIYEGKEKLLPTQEDEEDDDECDTSGFDFGSDTDDDEDDDEL